jgi:aspartyl-tRNA(Asn)/glutamyl-tRNA(Gln) amidotransferase subunit B
LEQDTAKSLHPRISDEISRGVTTRIDHNRSSTPLIEIITPPTLTSPHHAATAVSKIANLLRAIGSSSARLHDGALRCDVNVSLGLGSPRVEIKNLNSVRAVRDACSAEIEDQIATFNKQKLTTQQTKGWNGRKTIPLRGKEGEKDYRYLPDADLPAVLLNEEFIAKARADLPPLPEYLISILLNQPHNLDRRMATRLSILPEELSYYNDVLEIAKEVEGRTIFNWYVHGWRVLI